MAELIKGLSPRKRPGTSNLGLLWLMATPTTIMDDGFKKIQEAECTFAPPRIQPRTSICMSTCMHAWCGLTGRSRPHMQSAATECSSFFSNRTYPLKYQAKQPLLGIVSIAKSFKPPVFVGSCQVGGLKDEVPRTPQVKCIVLLIKPLLNPRLVGRGVGNLSILGCWDGLNSTRPMFAGGNAMFVEKLPFLIVFAVIIETQWLEQLNGRSSIKMYWCLKQVNGPLIWWNGVHEVIYLSIYLSIHLPIYLILPYLILPYLTLSYLVLSYLILSYLSIYISIDLSIDLSLCIYIYIYISISTYLSIYLSIDLSTYLSIYLSIYLYWFLNKYIYIYYVIIYTTYLGQLFAAFFVGKITMVIAYIYGCLLVKSTCLTHPGSQCGANDWWMVLMVTWDGKVGSDSDFFMGYVGKTIPPNNNFL